MSRTWTFDVQHPGESAAGMWPFCDMVTVTLDSGNPGGEDGEFAEYMREGISDWFDGAHVTLVKVEEGEK